MIVMKYIKPCIRTLNCSEVLEAMGPGCAQSGTLNVDVYRGAMLEKPYEYRLVQKVDSGIKGLERIDTQGVAHV